MIFILCHYYSFFFNQDQTVKMLRYIYTAQWRYRDSQDIPLINEKQLRCVQLNRLTSFYWQVTWVRNLLERDRALYYNQMCRIILQLRTLLRKKKCVSSIVLVQNIHTFLFKVNEHLNRRHSWFRFPEKHLTKHKIVTKVGQRD